MLKTPTDPVTKPTYKLGAGLDIAALTFTAATCLPDQEPSKALVGQVANKLSFSMGNLSVKQWQLKWGVTH